MTTNVGRDWSELKKPTSGGAGTRKEIIRVKLDKESTKIRLVGNVLPRWIRWITTSEGKKQPLEVISFNRETEEFTSARDPFNELSEEAYNEKPQFAYVVNCIDRADGKLKLLDLKLTVFRQLIDLAKDPEYGSPSDPKNGYDITIIKEKTGPLTYVL